MASLHFKKECQVPGALPMYAQYTAHGMQAFFNLRLYRGDMADKSKLRQLREASWPLGAGSGYGRSASPTPTSVIGNAVDRFRVLMCWPRCLKFSASPSRSC